MEPKLTNQEKQVLAYFAGKHECSYEELAQFCKDPTKVKLVTVKKIVSDIKKKYRDIDEVPKLPRMFSLAQNKTDNTISWVPKIISPVVNLVKKPVKENIVKQKQIQLKSTPGGNLKKSEELDAHIDFKLEPMYKRVRTKSGAQILSDNEWDIFVHLHKNAEKMVSLDELKNVVYKNWGSKTPAYWADSIRRTLTKLRVNIPELKTQNRLVTIMSSNTLASYMLK